MENPDERRDRRTVPEPDGTDAALWDLWFSRLHLPAVVVADELDIVSQLDRQPATADDLADAVNLTRRGMAALLAVLTGLGFLRKDAEKFHLTAIARQYLLPASPLYWGGVFASFRAMPDRHTPEKLLQALRPPLLSGDTRVTRDWEAGKVPEGMARRITEYMHAHSFPSAIGLARHADIGSASSLLDVGAGSGCFSIALALRHPQLQCTLLDLPEICAVASDFVREFGLQDQIRAHPANFFRDAWPEGQDAVLMSNILHDWPAERCKFLLEKSASALRPGGRVLIHEMLLDEDGLGLPASSFSLQMAAGTQGAQLTAAELTDLLAAAGFTNVRIVRSFAYFSTVTADKPNP
jgi:acetylserotonin N-methyltransferase